MRRPALALAIALAIAPSLAGCAAPSYRKSDVGYNRREVLPGSRGVFTGADGVWTIAPAGTASAKSGDACPLDESPEGGDVCPAAKQAPAPAPKTREVLLPAP